MPIKCGCLLSLICLFSLISYGSTPQVAGVSPEIAPVGTQVQINGSGFGASQGTSTVAFSTSSGGYANATVVGWSDTQILADVPAAATTGPVKVTAGGVASNTTIYFNVPPPQITSISPTTGVVGTQVTITGSGFQASQGTNSLAFNNAYGNIVSWSDTQIVATVPAGASTGPVWVNVNSISSNQDVQFTMPNPAVTALLPAIGPVGSQVQINGSGFGASQGSSTVVFTGSNATATVATWSDTQITVTVPATTTTGPLKVVEGGVTSNTSIVYTVPPPQITAITPTSGPISTHVTITGSGFQTTVGSSTVSFNGRTATIVSWSDTQIVAAVPSSATTGPITVTVNGILSNLDVAFEVPNPIVTAVVPSGGPVGTQVQINGSGFGASQSIVAFYSLPFGSANATVVSWSDTQIVATVPATATTGGVKITAGGVTSNTNIVFTIPAPQVTGIAPASGAVGTVVTINGSGFQTTKGSSTVDFNGYSASTTSWSDTQILATVPSNASSGPVKVTVNSVDSNQDAEFSMPNPTVTGLVPASGPVGTQVTINGSGFGATPGSSTLTFNGSTPTITGWNDSQILATVPSAATTGPVKVTVGGVSSNTNINFTVPPPQITGVSPLSGVVGTQVTITGSGFQDAPGSNAVWFNGRIAIINSWSNTQILATVQSGASTGPVKVTVNNKSSNQDFEFTMPNPVITGLSPAAGQVGSHVQINGSGFGATRDTSVVNFNGSTTATIVSWSDTQITAVVPSVNSSSVNVTVGGIISNSATFTVGSIIVNSVSPSAGPVGTQVTVSGAGFGTTQGSISFNNTAATAITSWSDSQIVATVPSGATTGAVKVVSGGISSNTSVSYAVGTVLVSGVSPSSGLPGSQVQISGSGFGTTQGLSSVTINGYSATVTSWSATQITVNAPNVATAGGVKVTVGGIASNTDVQFAILAPAVSSISPTEGIAGTQVQINGRNFGSNNGGSSTVAFNGVSAAIISWSDSLIQATVPSTARAGAVTVTVSSVISNNNIYFTVPAQQVTAVSPSSASVGDQVTITGTGFQSSPGSVQFYPSNVASIGTWSDTQILATVPAGATTGPVNVLVNGWGSNQDVVLTMPNPVVTSISPSSGAVGTQVQINGSGFGAPQPTSTITFNAAVASVVSWSDTQIIATVPSAAKSGPVFVIEGGVTGNKSVDFTVPAPHISSISPTNGPVGTPVTIDGTGFQATNGTSSVSFYHGLPPTITSWSDTQIVATVSNGTVTGPLEVLVNGVASNQDVVFETPSPVVDSIVPSSGPVGTQVTITGSGFGPSQGSSTVSFNNAIPTVVSWSDTQIVATIPSTATTAPVKISVGGVNSNANIYFTVPAPQIVNLFPASGAVGTQVTITGSGFQSTQGSSSLTFYHEGVAPTIVSWSDTQIVANVPGGALTGPVLVTVNGELSNQSTQFTMPAPVISSVLPTSGPVGTQVTINGSGFGSTQGSSTLAFNGETATVISWSDTQIQATVPSNAITGPVAVSVGGVSGNQNVYFTIPAPQITSISPTIGGVGNTVTITGSGFQATQPGVSGVQFYGGGTAAITSWSDTKIVATVPVGTLTGSDFVYVNTVDSNRENYTIPPNVVTSLSPATGPVGTQVTISGAGFGATQGTSVLTFDGQLPASISSWSDTQILATVPVTAITGPVAVNVNSVPSNLNVLFTVPPPAITSMSPAGGISGTQITISGSGFQAAQRDSTVTFNGVAATITTWSDTQIVTTVPATASTGPLLVTVNSVPSSSSNVFDVPNPVITSVDPPCGSTNGLYTVHGSGFGATQGAGLLYINGVQQGIAHQDGVGAVMWSDTSITFQLGSSTTSGPLTVNIYNATSNAVPFSVEGAPSVTSVSPAVGPVGSTVTISGSGFCAAQASSTIQFYGVNAAVTTWSDGQIVATVPAGASSGPVGVTVAGIVGSVRNFDLNTSAQVTDSFGRASSYTSVDIGGTWHSSDSSGGGCSSCTVRGNIHNDFDSLGNVTARTDELGHATSYTYDPNNNLASQSQQLGNGTPVTTSYTYNSFGEPLTVTDPLGNVTTNGYDANGNLTSVTSPAPAAGVAASVTSFAYDTKGELTQITDPLGHITTLAYYPTGLIQTITDPQLNVTTYEYDLRGNRTAVVDAMHNRTTFDYDLGNRLTKITYPDTTSVSFGYDSRGRRTSVTDQNGKITTYGYDDADRLTTVTDAALNVTTYAYDTENNLVSIMDAAGHTTSFTYDEFRRVTQTTFPAINSYETYSYDAAGNLTSKTDRKAQTIQYVYDALNRLTHKGYPDATGVDYVYDLAGKIKQVTDPTGTYGFAYDNMGRLIGTTTQYSFLPGVTYSNGYGYDAASNRTSFTAPDGSTVNYAYDTLNRLSSLTDSLTGQFTFGYDALSRRTSLDRPNGVNTAYTYDSLSRLLSVLHQAGTVTLDGDSYSYDNAGNRVSKTNSFNNTTENYSYDPLYQLTQVTQGLTTTESYTYDAVGNRLSSLGMTQYAYNSSNELTSTAEGTFTYDANGNTLTKVDSNGTTTYGWNFENQLTSVALPGTGGTVTFKYDPFGRRIQKSSAGGTTSYLYDGSNLLAEIDNAGNILARYTQGSDEDEHLSQFRSNNTSYYDQDAIASVTSLSNPAAGLTDTYSYDSFGNLAASTGSTVNPYRFTGREFDSEAGIYYNRARYYDPALGRFANEDPLRWFGNGPNFYSYVNSNPVNDRDPSGQKKFHGNWCGPDWTGGRVEEYDPAHDPLYKPPVDDLDRTCEHHDKCYYACRRDHPCDKEARAACMRQCDDVLTGEASSVVGKQNWGYGYVIWWGIKGHLKPDPGSNESCGCKKNSGSQ